MILTAIRERDEARAELADASREHGELVEEILQNADDLEDGGDAPAEVLAVRYVRALESRLAEARSVVRDMLLVVTEYGDSEQDNERSPAEMVRAILAAWTGVPPGQLKTVTEEDEAEVRARLTRQRDVALAEAAKLRAELGAIADACRATRCSTGCIGHSIDAASVLAILAIVRGTGKSSAEEADVPGELAAMFGQAQAALAQENPELATDILTGKDGNG